jgi:hypothetical protein
MRRILALLSLLILLAKATAAESVILSEFMADNTTGLKDEDGAYSDWIEIQNDGTTTVNLAGWALTDDDSDRAKWIFPSVTLTPGQFLVVFASGKDRRVAGSPLHTNFGLDNAGEYLALIKPGGFIATEYAPYPPQLPNKSYGIGQDIIVTRLVAGNAPVRALIPANGTLGSSWTATGFADGAWTAGTNGVGFENSVAGLAVTTYLANVGLASTSDAESVIATPSKRSGTFTETAPYINYFNTGGEAHYVNNRTFPGMAINVDVNNFVVEAVGTVTIPAAGNWSFGVNSDDGFSLTVGTFTTSYPSPRGPADTIATFNFPAAGDYPLRLVFYEAGGGAGLELFAAQGSLSGWTTSFKLVGDTANGGLAIRSLPFANGGGYRNLIGTDVQTAMMGTNATAYVRIPFTMPVGSSLSTLTLQMKYDDGFVAYINGNPVASRNAPGSPQWNSPATAPHANSAAVVYENIDVTPALASLPPGSNNVLAIQGLNQSAGDQDFLILPELAEFKTVGTTNHFFNTPSPGAINGVDFYAGVDTPLFDKTHGFYDTAFSVTLTCATPDATIRYTTNGTAPTATNGTVYTAPIAITGTTVLRAAAFANGYTASPVATQSYLFPNQIAHQPILPAGFPSTWGTGVNADYEMDPNVVNDPAYSGLIVGALKSIPSVSIVMNPDDLFGPSGIYSNPTQEGAAWERGASVEWIDPTGEGNEFQINCGIRAQGGASRNPGTSPKHGLRLLFKSQWGPSKLDFPMFEGSPVTKFDTLTLHARFNDAWVWNGASAEYIRDLWCRDTQLAMGRPSPAGTFVHLYLNGVYWGLYDPGEKPDASFAAEHLGGDKSEYDAVNSNEFIDGDANAWNTMMSIAGAGVTTDAAYAQLQQYLDVPGLIDYMIINLYAGNTDWPGHNWTAARRRVAGAGYKFFSWDAEWTFSGNSTDVTGVNTGNTPAYLYAQLRANAEFRQLFGDHVQRHFFNGGLLTPQPAEARWMKRATQIDQAIIGESARWGDYRTEPPMTRNGHWLPEQNRLRTQYFPQRTQIMINQFRAIGLYPAISAPAYNQNGGSVPSGFSLQMTNPNATGSILFTTDGTDPRLPGGNIAATAQNYALPIILNNHTVVRARVKDGATWSAVMDATFYTQQDFTPLVISEIMYNPPGSANATSDEYEFLEFKNTGSNALDLSGLTFTSGIAYSFPGGTTLGPGQFYVLARNAARFTERYPGVTIGGIFTGKLDNGGEKLELSHVLGTVVLAVTYDTKAPWPIAPSGNGFSLVPLDTHADLGNPANWRGSSAIYGSPGADDSAPAFPAVLINEVLTHSVSPQVDAIELFNPTAAPANVGGWFLSDDAAVPKKFVIPANTIIPAGGHVTFTEANFNPAPGVPPSFSLGADGDQVYLLSGNGTNLTGYSHGVVFDAAAAGVSFGRYVNSIGEEQFPAQNSLTFGFANSGPRVGPVVINEILYHPETGYDEFIELKNISGAAVNLFDPAIPANTWRLGGLDYSFPTGLTLPAGGYLLLVPIDPATFRTKYSVPAAVQIVGPYLGALQDSGERLRLQRPDAPTPNGIPLITVDEVRYNDKAPWPPSADGDGPSLQRAVSTAYGNDPAAWFASGLTPGTDNVVNQPPTVTLISPSNGATLPAVAAFTIEADAQDSDGTISKVEFFQGAVKLGEATAPPYRYTWSNIGAGTYAITAKARDNRLATAVTAPAIVTVTAPPLGNGAGLRGEYYDNVVNFSALGGNTPILTRIDPVVNFDWGGGSPAPTIGADTFSVRWTGQVQPRLSGSYAFYTYSDDGVRLWINGQLLVDNWTDHGPTENANTINLNAGQLYDVRMEFYENGGGAVAGLSWSATGLSKEAIPQSQLYPAGAPRIATQPLSQSVTTGGNVTLGVLASGTAPISYQWYFNNAIIPGATTPSLTLNGVQAGNAGNYTAIATNTSGSATSDAAILTVVNPDADNDGLPDAWETSNGFNPADPADATLDFDHDGQNNRDEYLAGTDPRDTQSVFKATALRNASGNILVRFAAVANKSYTVQFRASLSTGSWTKLGDVPAGAARTVDVPDPAIPSGTRYYRVVTPQQP